MPDTEINLDRVVEILHEFGIKNAYVEMTGGGVATIYAGPTREEKDWGKRYCCMAGPGTFKRNGLASTGDLLDFVIGIDDQGETDPVDAQQAGATNEVHVAQLIIAQIAKGPTEPLTLTEANSIIAYGIDAGRASAALVATLMGRSAQDLAHTTNLLYDGERKHRQALEVLIDIALDAFDKAHLGTVREYEEAVDILRFRGKSSPASDLDFHGGNWVDRLAARHPENDAT